MYAIDFGTGVDPRAALFKLGITGDNGKNNIISKYEAQKVAIEWI
jgi:hypothetical protein